MTNKLIVCLLTWIISVSNISCARATTNDSKKIERDADGLAVDLDPWVKKMALEHRENVKRIDQSFAEERKGDQFFNVGDYEQALVHYFKAQELTDGPKGVIMHIIAETYRKLRRYDDAIAILQKSIDTNQWNDVGKANAREFIKRLESERESAESASTL